MTSELRPAVEVWGDLTKALSFLYRKTDETAEEAATAIIEADREAVRAEQAAEVAKWRDKYNEMGQMALEQVSDLGTKLGRTETELDAAKADLQGANRELAKFKALAETLEGALPDDIDLFRIIRAAGRSNAAKAQAVHARLSEALRQYKEARDAS